MDNKKVASELIKIAKQLVKASHEPFTFNLASLDILPVGILKCETAEEQLDMLYEVADNPKTNKDKAQKILKLIKKMKDKMK